MLKFRLFIIILTVFIYAKNVHSLHCYISDFESIKSGNVKRLNHTLQDCSNYNNEVQLVNHQLQIPENETLHCYTVEVSKDVSIRGCTQKGGCNFLIDAVKSITQERGAFDSHHSSGKIACFECISDECNRIQSEYLQIQPTHSNFVNEPRGEGSRKCYHCLEPCQLDEAREKICGQSIGKSHEAVCSVQVAQGKDPSLAIRKCQVIQKDEQLSCPENSVCDFCRSDLCNKEVTLGTYRIWRDTSL